MFPATQRNNIQCFRVYFWDDETEARHWLNHSVRIDEVERIVSKPTKKAVSIKSNINKFSIWMTRTKCEEKKQQITLIAIQLNPWIDIWIKMEQQKKVERIIDTKILLTTHRNNVGTVSFPKLKLFVYDFFLLPML